MNDELLFEKRTDVLKDIMHRRFFELVALSIYTGLFFVPAILWLVFSNYTFIGENNIYNIALKFLVLALFIGVGGIGISGALYFWKKACWNEGSIVRRDFFEGVKKNRTSFFFLYFTFGLFYAAIHIALAFTGNSTGLNDTTKGIIEGLLYLILLLMLMVVFFYSAQSIIYQASFIQYLVNSVKFTLGALYKNVPIFIIVLLPYLLFEFVPLNIVSWLMCALAWLFYFGFSTLVFTLYSHSIFDISINKKTYPQIYRKGLRAETVDVNIKEHE